MAGAQAPDAIRAVLRSDFLLRAHAVLQQHDASAGIESMLHTGQGSGYGLGLGSDQQIAQGRPRRGQHLGGHWHLHHCAACGRFQRKRAVFAIVRQSLL